MIATPAAAAMLRSSRASGGPAAAFSGALGWTGGEALGDADGVGLVAGIRKDRCCRTDSQANVLRVR